MSTSTSINSKSISTNNFKIGNCYNITYSEVYVSLCYLETYTEYGPNNSIFRFIPIYSNDSGINKILWSIYSDNCSHIIRNFKEITASTVLFDISGPIALEVLDDAVELLEIVAGPNQVAGE